jgi:drug/metabolite transporter (DMT)-like permease
MRVRSEATIAALAGLLGVVTVFWHDWIEAVSGWDPDRHDGGLEWLIVTALLTAAAGMAVLARRHWRELAAAVE